MKDKFCDSSEDWFTLIYNFEFSDAFRAILESCKIDNAQHRLVRWKSEQENMDTFEAEVFILTYWGKLE